MKVCSKCKEKKELDNFSINKSNKDGLQKYCKSCKKQVDNRRSKSKNRELNIVRIERSSKKVWDLKRKKGGKCSKCNEDRLHVLEFHHLDPKQKVDQINNLVQFYGMKNWHIAEQEADKCILLCSNCHKDFHYLESKNKITITQYLAVAELVRHYIWDVDQAGSSPVS